MHIQQTKGVVNQGQTVSRVWEKIADKCKLTTTVMFAIRKVHPGFPRSLARVSRGNATIAANSTASQPSEPTPPPAPAIANKTEGRKRKVLPKRPPISLESPRKWLRPLKPGILPAYDLALSMLRRDSENLKAEAAELRMRISEKEAVYAELEAKLDALRENASDELEAKVTGRQRLEEVDAELENMLEKLNILEAQSQINLPNVRWMVNNAMGTSCSLSFQVGMVFFDKDMKPTCRTSRTDTLLNKSGERRGTWICW